MTYIINREQAKEESDAWHANAEKGGRAGLFGMSLGILGLSAAIILTICGVNYQPYICFGVMLLGAVIMGLSGAFIGSKPLSAAFLEAEQSGKILFLKSFPVSPKEPDILMISAMIQKADGKCEVHELGYAKAQLHTQYSEDTLDINNAIVYVYPTEAAT
ncbi:MAG: hypothetical protein IJZ68_09360 [Bacteroidaceae bacterium]|nr:hypothetical protein [Bacteroidaceae bacterium]